MTEYVLFLVLGLSVGAVYAALTLGVVVTYQGAGVINFAVAAMATVPLYVFDDLTRGKLTLPIPWMPSFELDQPPATWVCVVVALMVAAVIGALVELCVSRPLRHAPVLAKVVAAIGVMLTLQAAVGLTYGTDARVRTPLLPTGVVDIGGASVPTDRIWLIALVAVLGIGLATWSRFSRTGLSIQAAAENERAAAFARLSTANLGMLTWVLASVVTALVMIMAGPATGVLTPDILSLLVVPALAAALIARLRSLWWGLVGAFGLGVAQAELQFLSSTKDWWPESARQNIGNVVPFVVIVIVLALFGRSIPSRGDEVLSSLPPVIVPKNRPIVVTAFALAGLVLLLALNGSYRFGLITSLAMSLIALSLVVLTGMVGQISLAQAAFAGTAGLFLSKIGTDLPFPISMLVAAALAACLGVVVGLPALRIRGAQLAVVTLAAGLTIEKFVLSNPAIADSTANIIPSPSFLGIDLAVRDGRDIARIEFGIMVLVVVMIAFVLVGNLMRSGSGRKMLAVRSNERAASAIGINVAGIKLTAFALASFLAGLGGTLIGYSRGQLSPASFGVFVGLSLLAIAYLCGITSVSGAAVAGASAVLGIAFVFFDEHLHVGPYYTLLTGISLILTVLLNPVGLVGKMQSDLRALGAMIRRRRGRDTDPTGTPVAAGAQDTEPRPANRAPREIGDVVLDARDVKVVYGGLVAVDGVHLSVRAGEIVGLIGPNGAGKTSFVDAITGFTPAQGTVTLRDADVAGLSPHARARRGLVRTWQAGELFNDLSVESNVRVADDIGNDLLKLGRDFFRPNGPTSDSVRASIELMGLQDVAARTPAELPLGRQKALGVARALALQPAALLLDEPAAGLDSVESLAFGEQVRDIAASGVGCLLIDHDMHLVMGVCDRIYVVEFGQLIAEGTPEEVRRDPRVIASYLGAADGDPGDDAPADAVSPGDRPLVPTQGVTS
ncbi:ATP-binding cassette domain-containing protein [Nocardioides sp. QY071]|uniref:ABC transporter permease subunit n=1 Tax=Nocardioides sp. QY071 TaxID=3044187 RepID=UPI00249A930D|nr:ATP-binding cassette domain-containing protein [Nocardioides sp. QY071]WGY00384.1 ATP-binding cassette domain-containing protein [Nocardioides sp. QY071]